MRARVVSVEGPIDVEVCECMPVMVVTVVIVTVVVKRGEVVGIRHGVHSDAGTEGKAKHCHQHPSADQKFPEAKDHVPRVPSNGPGWPPGQRSLYQYSYGSVSSRMKE